MTTSKSNDKAGRGAPPTQGGPTNILKPGTLIGDKFRIEERIARGGQASVYRARQEPLNRPVALKLLSPPSLEATDEEREAFEQRFLLEARTLAGLDHPNIVTIFDYGETDDGRYYLAMEYIQGETLPRPAGAAMEPGRGQSWSVAQVYATRTSGVVHRDEELQCARRCSTTERSRPGGRFGP